MAYKYCTATNWGKNFFTHEERKQFHLSGHPGDVWVVGDNLYGDQWISKVSGAIKSKAEAQAIVTGTVDLSPLSNAPKRSTTDIRVFFLTKLNNMTDTIAQKPAFIAVYP